ncbi:hypothetical protein B296_00059275 [Ensete ventricosum]|uniref:Uncharacterized protein n=1 Tax=Ensete ventricosum TaxID=4639 RepID=A0A426XIJ7_ENSVE|nr:hypothetical protein B296_00059275 [Ensete ventricosum]
MSPSTFTSPKKKGKFVGRSGSGAGAAPVAASFHLIAAADAEGREEGYSPISTAAMTRQRVRDRKRECLLDSLSLSLSLSLFLLWPCPPPGVARRSVFPIRKAKCISRRGNDASDGWRSQLGGFLTRKREAGLFFPIKPLWEKK